MSQQFYSDEEAEAILRVASEKVQAAGMSRETLLQTAAELGIPAEAVEEAERTVLARTKDGALRRLFDRHARQEFFGHVVSYVIMNSVFVVVDFSTYSESHTHWAYWPMLGWGIGLAFHAVNTFNRNGDEYEKEFEKWKGKRERKGSVSSIIATEIANRLLERHAGDSRGAALKLRAELRLRRREARSAAKDELFR